MEVIACPPDVSEKTPFEDVDVRPTVTAPLLAGLFQASCSWTVNLPRVGLELAEPEKLGGLRVGAAVKTSFAGGASDTVYGAFVVDTMAAPEEVVRESVASRL